MPTEEPTNSEATVVSESNTGTKTVDLDNQNPPSSDPKIYQFSQKKLIIYSILIVGIIVLVGFGGYYLGMSNVPETVVVKEEPKKVEEKQPDLVSVGVNEEAKAKNGVTVKLEEAKIDQTYEKQKEESKKYYQNASNSAYLDSEYYKSSNLQLKVSLKNTTTKPIGYSTSDFRLKDSDDNQYSSGGDYEGQGTPKIYNLNPSETTKLNQAYIIPTSEDTFTLIYQNVEINFSISR